MTNKNTARWVRYLLVAVVLVGLVALAVWPRTLKVDHASVARATVQETLEAEGRTRVRERHDIVAPLSGVVRRLTLSPGDVVRAGQTLALLDPAEVPTLDARSRSQARAQEAAAQSQWQGAQEAVRAAHAATGLAQAELQRLRPLAAQGMVSALALEQAQTAHERAVLAERGARFQEASALHHLQAARAALRRDGPGDGPLAVRSPVDGVVLHRAVESARPVVAGQPLLTVGDPAALEVAVDVLSSDAVRLSPGMRVELLRWGGEPALLGDVSRVEPGAFTKTSALGVEEQRVWVIVALRSPRSQWERLGEAYRVNARFVLREVQGALRAPSSAVFRQGEGGWAVFRVDGGRARLTPVTVGLSGEGWTEIASGLSEGDRVVPHPPRELTDGARVATP